MNRQSDTVAAKTKDFRRNFLLNLAALLLSSACITVLSLLFAIGTYFYEFFFRYFSHPLILLLNYLPVLLLQALLLSLFNRQWLAFLMTAIPVFCASIGHFFKMKFRGEAFFFSDLRVLSTALRVTEDYPLSLNNRIALAICMTVLITALLFFFCRGRLRPLPRLALALVILISLIPLWNRVYSDEIVYAELTRNDELINTGHTDQVFISKGFVYPFIHSIRDVLPPEGYRAKDAAAVLSAYHTARIPSSPKVNIMVIQLESFCDLEAMGFPDIPMEAYAVLHQLQTEGLSGTMIANSIGGGTQVTEMCFLTGSYGGLFCHNKVPSYVRYFNDQGYYTSGAHPNTGDYYNRTKVSEYLGFQEYRTFESYYEPLVHLQWTQCDDVLFEDIFEQYRELSSAGRRLFSFTVSLQGHGPYLSERYDVYDQDFWKSENCSEESCRIVSRYLGSVMETQKLLLDQLESVRSDKTPLVVLFYGDHPPYLTSQSVYDEAGVSFDLETEDGILRYYGTPYVIWANDAAKRLCESDFVGDGPTISPGYLMNLLFHELGWKGDAFLQYTDTAMELLPVVSTQGYTMEGGRISSEISDEGRRKLNEYACVQYYYHGLSVG